MEHLKLCWSLYPKATAAWAAVCTWLFYTIGSIFMGLI